MKAVSAGKRAFLFRGIRNLQKKKQIFSTKFINPDSDTACTRESAKHVIYCTASFEWSTSNFAFESWVLLDTESVADSTGSFLVFTTNAEFLI